ncbi:TLD-domain-containing protein [Punctularia strigosozonata HHB-11173 SS5]|uniref:TLD-domain-containing protein n=1 Tax=Punctularia strigosozonata (strain HHB-11173) TaxID=741275 RepID=UPI00044165C1|nr:TLD-domain-containing protein [Punctularia strigosozonata HHB-11173 SS5]EIN05656.1 TLD-domain-containing protein [Punctularia strigosozonata HHB-11173 SS5]
MLTSRAYPQEERTPVSALFANAVSSGSKTIPLAIPSTSKSIPAPAPKGHQLMHAGSLPVLGTIGRVVGESLDTDVNVKHGTPFAAHAFVPSSGAPGFDGARSLNPKGFEYDSKTVERASVNLAGRKEMTTPVLTVDLADKIRAHLPALARLPRTWNLLYSLDQHGISLKTLYARCQNHLKGTLVVVKDSGDALFGAWIGDGIRVSPGAYYGSGESFLWRVRGGNVQVYRWSGRNDYVALCEQKFISFGGGDGHYGLFLDDQLFEGSSAPCPTFNNEALCSDGPRKGSTVSFECVGVEVWGMG